MTAGGAPARSPWPMVLLLYACGLLAAAQLGKMSALAPVIGAALGIGLAAMALAISLIEVGGATLGSVAGRVAQRVGLPRCLRAAVAALALAGLGGAGAEGTASLFAWRLVEAAGYLGVIVSAPVLIAVHAGRAGDRVQGLTLTLWSSFVPVGLALGAWASAGLAAERGWRFAVAAGGAVGVLLWLVVWRTRLPAGPASAGASSPAPGATAEPVEPARAAQAAQAAKAAQAAQPVQPVLTVPPVEPAQVHLPAAARWLALAFGGFALFEVGVLGLLPTLLVEQAGMGAASAGRWTALASVSAVAGSLGAALVVRRGMAVHWPILLSIGLPPWLLFGVFRPAPEPAVALTLVVLVNMVGGVFASLAFAVLPRLAGSPRHLVRANGLLAQCGASGSLLGPPTMAASVQALGWTGAAVVGLLVSALAVPLAWRAVGALR